MDCSKKKIDELQQAKYVTVKRPDCLYPILKMEYKYKFEMIYVYSKLLVKSSWGTQKHLPHSIPYEYFISGLINKHSHKVTIQMVPPTYF